MSKSNRSFRDIFSVIGKVLLRFFTRNWLQKLLAILVAIILWAALISQDNTLTREKVFTDVSVSVSGADYAMSNNGLIVISGLEDEALTVRMRVEVPQGMYKTVTASSYNPRIDLTRLTSPGEQSLPITTTSTTTNGTVTQLVPDSISVVVDEYVTNYRVPVSINVIGEYPEGMGGGTPVADPSTVAVSGPKTVVDRIARVCVDYDLSQLSGRNGSLRTAMLYRFVDAEGNELSSDQLRVTNANVVLRSITVAHTVYPVKKVPVSTLNLVSGIPSRGYEVVDVHVSPSSLIIGGNQDALDGIESIELEMSANADEEYETFTQVIRIIKPSNITYFSADTVTITVEIQPITITKEFSDVRLNASNLSTLLRVKNLPKAVSVRLTGNQNELNTLKSNRISAYIDFSGITEAGIYTLPVTVQVNDEYGYTFTVSNPMEMIVIVENK